MVKRPLLDIGFAYVSVTSASSSLFDEQAGQEKLERDTAIILQELEQKAGQWMESSGPGTANPSKSSSTRGSSMGITSLLYNSKRRHPCDAGRGLVGVSADGGVYLCHRFVGQEECKMGTVFGDKLDRKACQETMDMQESTQKTKS